MPVQVRALRQLDEPHLEPAPAAVGPIRLSGCLALLATLMVAGAMAWDAWLGKRLPHPRWLMLLPLAPLVTWRFVEFVVRRLFADPSYYGVARVVRWVVLSLLVVALVAAGWLVRSSYLRHPPHWTPVKGQNGK